MDSPLHSSSFPPIVMPLMLASSALMSVVNVVSTCGLHEYRASIRVQRMVRPHHERARDEPLRHRHERAFILRMSVQLRAQDKVDCIALRMLDRVMRCRTAPMRAARRPTPATRRKHRALTCASMRDGI